MCSSCIKPNTGYAWCKICDPGQFSTSGNSKIDNLIREKQLQTIHYYDNLEWIPHNKFEDITPIGEGGFATIYSATWPDGAPKFDKKKNRTGPIKVALKRLKDSEIETFINEVNSISNN